MKRDIKVLHQKILLGIQKEQIVITKGWGLNWKPSVSKHYIILYKTIFYSTFRKLYTPPNVQCGRRPVKEMFIYKGNHHFPTPHRNRMKSAKTDYFLLLTLNLWSSNR